VGVDAHVKTIDFARIVERIYGADIKPESKTRL